MQSLKKLFQTNYLFLLMLLMLFFGNINLRAQEETPDTLASAIEKLQSDLTVLSRLKISGYIQAQYQIADTAGISTYAGGNFESNVDNRFMVRRGRFKLAYTNEFSQYVMQVDVTEKGVGIKDAYVSFTDPWLQTYSLTGGVFDRPFGYEISYSSGTRESPERSRIFQTLFPGEREVGAKLTIQPPKTSRFYFFRLEGGFFNGAGPTAVDFDSYKDFIGHLSFFKSLSDENISLSGGLSYYKGGWRQNTKYIYEMEGSSFKKDSAALGDKVKRQYFGLDAQLSIANNPIGLTTIRGEYIWGDQPGQSDNSTSPTYSSKYSTAQPQGDVYLRKAHGGYVYFLQNIGQSKHQFIAKYDWYDPNTQVSGNQIGVSGSNTSAADLKYTTLGLGWIYRWNSQVKITAYYDMVTNETSNSAAAHIGNTLKFYAKDRKDNVFTLRVQYKF